VRKRINDRYMAQKSLKTCAGYGSDSIENSLRNEQEMKGEGEEIE
jgi:hypothetical protein